MLGQVDLPVVPPGLVQKYTHSVRTDIRRLLFTERHLRLTYWDSVLLYTASDLRFKSQIMRESCQDSVIRNPVTGNLFIRKSFYKYKESIKSPVP